MAGKPCLGLRDGIIAQILSVRHRHILTKLAEDIVSQLVDGVGNEDRRDLLLHLPQFLQRDRNGDLSEGAGLLILQNGKARVPILHIGRHDLSSRRSYSASRIFSCGSLKLGISLEAAKKEMTGMG